MKTVLILRAVLKCTEKYSLIAMYWSHKINVLLTHTYFNLFSHKEQMHI